MRSTHSDDVCSETQTKDIADKCRDRLEYNQVQRREIHHKQCKTGVYAWAFCWNYTISYLFLFAIQPHVTIRSMPKRHITYLKLGGQNVQIVNVSLLVNGMDDHVCWKMMFRAPSRTNNVTPIDLSQPPPNPSPCII